MEHLADFIRYKNFWHHFLDNNSKAKLDTLINNGIPEIHHIINKISFHVWLVHCEDSRLVYEFVDDLHDLLSGAASSQVLTTLFVFLLPITFPWAYIDHLGVFMVVIWRMIVIFIFIISMKYWCRIVNSYQIKWLVTIIIVVITTLIFTVR